jgi:hypothetical protein
MDRFTKSGVKGSLSQRREGAKGKQGFLSYFSPLIAFFFAP